MRNRSVQQGLALLAVLWMVAALSVIVTGLTASVRNELRLVSTAREAVVARAIGAAAINLVLQNMLSRPERPASLMQIVPEFAGQRVPVQIMPLNGLIDINHAPQGLLAQMFMVANGVDANTARALSDAVLAVRDSKDASGKPIGFAAPEDMMRTAGLGYDLYLRVAPLVTADLQGSGKINALAANVEVLTVLANGNREQANRIDSQRAAGLPGIDTSTLSTGFTEPSAVSRYRLQARVPLSRGSWVVCTQTVDLDPAATIDSPWRILRSQYHIDALQSGER